MNDDQNVCIIGMGYVGLTLAAVMAEAGFNVWGVEKDPKILNSIKRGIPHFMEKGFEARLKNYLKLGKLHFVGQTKTAVVEASPTVFLITVGTPLDANNKPRLDMVRSVAEEVAELMPDNAIIILRSTVQLGTTRRIVLPALERSPKNFMLAYCPERTIEGNAMNELRYLPQIVGGLSQEAEWRATVIFQKITSTVIRVSSVELAEIIKLIDNSFRDLSFAIGNEVALLCEAAGLDGNEVINAANTGYARTQIPSPGFVGGPCLHKDPHILQESLLAHHYTAKLISQGRQLNESIPAHVCDRVAKAVPLSATSAQSKISVLGLAFKGRPETDDIRESPSLDLIKLLQQRYPDAKLCVHDFEVSREAMQELGLCAVSLEEAFNHAAVVIVANNHVKYEWVDWDPLMASMVNDGVVFDVWSVLSVHKDNAYPNHVKVLRLGTP